MRDFIPTYPALASCLADTETRRRRRLQWARTAADARQSRSRRVGGTHVAARSRPRQAMVPRGHDRQLWRRPATLPVPHRHDAADERQDPPGPARPSATGTGEPRDAARRWRPRNEYPEPEAWDATNPVLSSRGVQPGLPGLVRVDRTP